MLGEYLIANYIATYPDNFSINEAKIKDSVTFDVWKEILQIATSLRQPDSIFLTLVDKNISLLSSCWSHMSNDFELSNVTTDIILFKIGDNLISEDQVKRKKAVEALKLFPYQSRLVNYFSKIFPSGNSRTKKIIIYIISSSSAISSSFNLLILALLDNSKSVKKSAAKVLILLGKESIKPLFIAYKKYNSLQDRQEIIRVLNTLLDEEGLRYFLATFGSNDLNAIKLLLEDAIFLESEDVELNAIAQIIERKRIQARMDLEAKSIEEKIKAIETIALLGTKEDSQALFELLKENNSDISLLTIETLGETNVTTSFPLLLQLISSATDEHIIEVSVRSLGLLRNKFALNALLNALEHRNPRIRTEAAQALGRLRSKEAMESLEKHLVRESNSFVKAYSGLALGLIKNASVVSSLISCLYHEQERVRGFVTQALSFIGEPSTKPYIVSMLKDSHHQVRQQAACGIGLLGDESLVAVLNDSLRADSSHHVRQWAVLALGMIGSAEGIPSLRMAVKDPISYVRTSAIAALNEISDPSTADLFIEVILDTEQDQFARQQAILGLGRLGILEHIHYILRLLEDDNEHIRTAVAHILGEAKEPQYLPYLLQMLDRDKSTIVRDEVVRSIRKIGKSKPETIPQITKPLRAALSDSSDFVRSRVISTLNKLDPTGSKKIMSQSLKQDASIFVRIAAKRGLDRVSNDSKIVKQLHDSEDATKPFLDILDRTDPSRKLIREIEEGYFYKVIYIAMQDSKQTRRTLAKSILKRYSKYSPMKLK